MGPKPYPVVYDAELGLQYAFEQEYVNIPVAAGAINAGVISTDLTAQAGTYYVDTNAASITVTLPLAASVSGQQFAFVSNVNTLNSVTYQLQEGDTILSVAGIDGGASTSSTALPNASVTFVSDGGTHYIALV